MAGKKKTLYIEDDVLKNLEQDTFGHKHIAEAVVNSIQNTNPPFTIGIFGGWGTGKSSLLEIINSILSEKVATVTIDAWRYSSADNLRRAFLIHVTNDLAPGLLDELRRKLFSSEQETLPAQPSKVIPSSKNFWEKIWDGIIVIVRLGSKFIGLFILFFMVLFLVFSIILIIQNSGFNGFWQSFDWNSFQEKFLDLAFIPLLLAIVDDIRLYIIQRPVTIIHERIDADELFSDYFNQVVEKATSGPFAKKQLVIFIDNLDRLTDDKMVEALESLKTYLNNDKCVFIVACDDNVVRNVINKSNKIPDRENSQGDKREGEHYLDKFFQQTFRLPEYMRINLQDFAEQNFQTTLLYDDLKARNVDIRYLISIILPSDASSPRKVKRLLNEFIALYEIVKRRENGKDGQLKPGLLTGNVEFLGKFSTLRAEYPNFYGALVDNTNLLAEMTSLLSTNIEEARKKLMAMNIPNIELLLAYLRKTQTIMVYDIEPYIWLSQDALALGLKGNHLSSLRTALSDGDSEKVKTLLEDSESSQYATLIARVASRMVAERLAGIEQQNGVKVLSYLLPEFDETIRPEIAHVTASLMSLWPTDSFYTSEIFNVLRWAQRGGIETQRKTLIDNILSRLDNPELRQFTFELDFAHFKS
jgi:hypothetical protein